MTATILQFPTAAPKQAKALPLTAQPFGPDVQASSLAGAVPFSQEWADRNLELAIDRAHFYLLHAESEAEQYTWWERMKRLCSLRSAGQIERMERVKGLR